MASLPRPRVRVDRARSPRADHRDRGAREEASHRRRRASSTVAAVTTTTTAWPAPAWAPNAADGTVAPARRAGGGGRLARNDRLVRRGWLRHRPQQPGGCVRLLWCRWAARSVAPYCGEPSGRLPRSAGGVYVAGGFTADGESRRVFVRRRMPARGARSPADATCVVVRSRSSPRAGALYAIGGRVRTTQVAPLQAYDVHANVGTTCSSRRWHRETMLPGTPTAAVCVEVDARPRQVATIDCF